MEGTNGDRNDKRPSSLGEHAARNGIPLSGSFIFGKEDLQSFRGISRGSGYAEHFLKIMNVNPDWTVLDMACADGTLAIPLAGRMKSITAVDFSENMLEILKRRCIENSITNVSAIHGQWEDDWNVLGIGIHDVAIASWLIRADDLLDSALKLDRIARKQVYISMAVGDGPFDRRIYEATGRKLNMGPSFTYVYYNVLHENMGILANIAFIREAGDNDWGSQEEALDSQRWMFRDLTAEEEKKMKTFLDEHLIRVNGRWRLPYERECQWVVMSWEKK